MPIKTVQVSLDKIDDNEGLESIETALKNIEGVTAIRLEPEQNRALVEYDDTDTSYHAIKAAITMVDYVTQPFPIDAPQHPDN